MCHRPSGLVVWLCLLLAAACNRPLRNQATPTEPAPPGSLAGATGTSEGVLVSGGVSRHYLLHVPASYQAGTAVPLVINFHGFNSNSRQEEALTGMSAKADQEGFVVVYPDGVNATWYPGHGAEGQADLRFVRDLITWLEGQYTIDPQRLYATGISNGGGMTNRLGCDLADIVAAIAPDSGAYNFWQDCAPSRPIPVLAFHGLDDKLIAYAGGVPRAMLPPIEEWAAAWAARNGCEASPAVTTPVATVTLRTWAGCQAKADVLLYTLANHGHSWPGSALMPKSITSQALNATDVMWEFFVNHPLP